MIAAKLRDGEALSVPAAQVAVVFGTSLATHPEGIHRLAELTADAIGARGPRPDDLHSVRRRPTPSGSGAISCSPARPTLSSRAGRTR
ncbi:MAG: hypothetical protein R3B70_11420 [Polyangiaceae bacterium]